VRETSDGNTSVGKDAVYAPNILFQAASATTFLATTSFQKLAT
jgi:hypothetical protein